VVEKAEEKPVKDEKPAEAAASTKSSSPTDAKETVAKKSLLLQMIGTTGSNDGSNAVNDLLGDDGASMKSLDQALNGVNGVQEATAKNLGVKSGSGGGREDAKVGVGVATGGTASTGTGVKTVVKPKVVDGVADADVEEGDKGNIASVIRKNSGRIMSCTEQALKGNPDLSGRVGVGFSIVAGKVTESHLVKNSTNDDALGKCITSAVRTFRFDPGLTAEVAEFPWVVSGQ
jgi:hypothetical protein